MKVNGAFVEELYVVGAFSDSFLIVENSTSMFFGTLSSFVIVHQYASSNRYKPDQLCDFSN